MAPPVQTNEMEVLPRLVMGGAQFAPLQQPSNRHDPLHLITALQTTLEVEELIVLFHERLEPFVACDALIYREPARGIAVTTAKPGRHSGSYQLKLMGESLGELVFTRGRRFSEEELATLEHLLCHLLYPLRNALRYHDALASAYRDPLTGIGNRGALERALDREIRLARRQGTPLALTTCDVDHFKNINDTYGHAAGDRVLRCVARNISAALRGSDMVFRFGGEEFVVLLSNTDREGALHVAERIRSLVESNPCEWEGGEVHVTISLGVSTLHGDGQELFDDADRALYQAKAAGRNRVVMAEEHQA